jgi:hypothetical protein
MGKRAKQRRDQHYDQVAKYQRLASEALAALSPRLRALDPPVVDAFPIADFHGRPENLHVWYAFRTPEEQRLAEGGGLSDRLRTLTVCAAA